MFFIIFISSIVRWAPPNKTSLDLDKAFQQYFDKKNSPIMLEFSGDILTEQF